MPLESWRYALALEQRYDGPIPPDMLATPPMVVALRRRMRLHRRLALDFARQARAVSGDGRARVNYAQERRAHSTLARLLGAALRGC